MMVASDDPSVGMRWGGYIAYNGTAATDDDEGTAPGNCAPGTWRHRYWALGANNAVEPLFSNGCINLPIYCRRL